MALDIDLTKVLQEVMGAPGFIHYVARVNGEAVGEAAMRIDDDLAQIAGGGTQQLPAAAVFRKHFFSDGSLTRAARAERSPSSQPAPARGHRIT